jgi:hypothetical protein
VLANFSLLRCNSIAQARVECPQGRQRIRKRGGPDRDFDIRLAPSEFTQGSGNVKSYSHDHLYYLRDFLDFVRDSTDFERDERAGGDLGDDLRGARAKPEASSTIALRTHATGGNPSRILCQLLPSSLDANSFPLRVPK